MSAPSAQTQSPPIENFLATVLGEASFTRVAKTIVRESISVASLPYVQVRLTLIFNTISCGLQSKAANNRINTVYDRLWSMATREPHAALCLVSRGSYVITRSPTK